MGGGTLTLVLCVAIIVPCHVGSTTSENVKELYTHIFINNSYNKYVRPVSDFSRATKLLVDLDLVGITEIDEVNEKMTSTGSLFIMWNDENLQWDSPTYNDTHTIYLPQNLIWKPDISLDNGFTKLKELGDNFILTTITSDGQVIWRPFEVFETKCAINIRYFPFDKQTCSLKFGVWTHPLLDIEIEVGNNGIMLYDYKENSEWSLIGTYSTASISSHNGAYVTFTVTLQRKPQYILNNVVLPIVLLSLLSGFVFVLPIESGEKMGYVMTVYLAFAVFLTIVSASLPESSTMSLLSMYLTVLMVMGTSIVMITTAELRLHYREDSQEIPKFCRYMIRLSKRLQCKKTIRKVDNVSNTDAKIFQTRNKTGEFPPIEDSETLPSTEAEEPETIEEFTWPDVTAAIDFFCFWLFLITNVVTTLGLFVSGYIMGNS
ncbi:acetylcholine receptor subunit delta-like [Argopecten irradians]|uniref:acetylcholine receptor subunit delta-like n=1 Tax=Argopecten irradians TaxID=31199 RepID=UPI003717DBA7